MNSIAHYLSRTYKQADRLMLYILWGLFVMSLGLSGLHDTLRWSLLIGLPAAALPSALIVLAGGTALTRRVVAAALMVFAALHIHQAAGMTELHFGIFVLLAFLLCYRDWSVIVVAAAVIAVHHLSFNYLQELGYGVLCMVKPGLGIVVIHAAYVVAESAVLAYLAILLHREALQDAELKVSVAGLTRGEAGTIDLSENLVDAKSANGIALQKAMALMKAAIASVAQGVDTVAAASSEIATSNSDLSARTEQQAASLGETAGSMATLTQAVRHNTDHARQANALAQSASSVAARGGAVVVQVVDTMSSIDASSKKIVDIISVIDGIAFQTNILALNAAVEAARAGEQGRGFAVVASEVRNLAQRSAAAAKEIKTLINDSVDKVVVGTELVGQAGTTMSDILSSVKQVTDIMAEIMSASQQQGADIEQVNLAVGQMDQVTHQTAARVQESAAAAAQLQAQAQRLMQVVTLFKLGGPEGERTAAVPRTTAGPAVKALGGRSIPADGTRAGGPNGVARPGAGSARRRLQPSAAKVALLQGSDAA